MKLDRLLCTAVVEELQTALGPAGPGLQSEEALSLVTAAEDQVWVWSAGRQELLVCGTGERGGGMQTLELTSCPSHSVAGIVIGPAASWLVLWGEGGVTALEVPGRPRLHHHLAE